MKEFSLLILTEKRNDSYFFGKNTMGATHFFFWPGRYFSCLTPGSSFFSQLRIPVALLCGVRVFQSILVRSLFDAVYREANAINVIPPNEFKFYHHINDLISNACLALHFA